MKPMRNRRMQEKIEKGEALDLSGCKRNKDGDYIMDGMPIDNMDYCDAKAELWINSIGYHRITSRVFASTSNKFYQNPAFECLFLR